MNQLFYVYGLKGNEDAVMAVLSAHNLSFNVLQTLHSEGFEYEIPITLPNPEFNAAVAGVNAITSCWVQPTRKGSFLKPSNMFIETYNVDDTCKRCSVVSKIIHSCHIFSAVTHKYDGTRISSKSDCSSYKIVWTDAGVMYDLKFESLDLATVYYTRQTNNTTFNIEGMEI